MNHRPARLSGGTKRTVARQAGALATAAAQRIESEYSWYSTLSAADRSWVGVVAQAGIADFIRWLGDDQPRNPDATEVFAAAPRELTRSITLAQTLDLIRAVVDEVEGQVDSLASRRDLGALRENVLRYSRELAFEAARIYAGAAEEHGAVESRLEALVVDAVLRGEADEGMRSRATALGWGQVVDVVVVAGSVPAATAGHSDPTQPLDRMRRIARRAGHPLLSAIQGRRLICILGAVGERPTDAVNAILDHFGEGPVVIGPTVPHLFASGRSARAALAGLRAAPAWPAAPRPCLADDLIAERALAADGPARSLLHDRIWIPLTRNESLLETASAYLESRGGLEGTARTLFVHTNTVRYRLGRITDVIGYDLTEPHDAFTVRVAIALGRLGANATAPRPRSL